jgi:hypothetical protein
MVYGCSSVVRVPPFWSGMNHGFDQTHTSKGTWRSLAQGTKSRAVIGRFSRRVIVGCRKIEIKRLCGEVNDLYDYLFETV